MPSIKALLVLFWIDELIHLYSISPIKYEYRIPFMIWKLQTTFSNLSSMKVFEFQLQFHWSLFPRVQLIISQHWFRQWLGTEQARNHYPNQCWPNYMNPGYFTLAAIDLKPQQMPMFLHISARYWGRRWSPHTSEQKGCMLKPQTFIN